MDSWLTVAICAFALSAVAVRIAMLIAKRLAFLDRPGAEAHKQQAMAVPYGAAPPWRWL